MTRNLLRIAIFNNLGGLFPEKDFDFDDESVRDLEMKIEKLMPVDAESCRLIDSIGNGVYDAVHSKYLKTLLFCVCESVDGPTIEEYAFSFSYSNSDSSHKVSMTLSLNDNKKGGIICNSTTDITPIQMRSFVCEMVRTLVQLMRTLDKMPNELIIRMKLLYYNDVTPPDYEAPFCSEEEAHTTKTHLKIEIEKVNNQHLLTLKVGTDMPSNFSDASQGVRSLTSILAVNDNDCIAMAVDSRESRVERTKSVSVCEYRNKLIEVYPTVYLAGTGRCSTIDVIAGAFKAAKDTNKAKVIDDMDFLAKRIKDKMIKICLKKRVNLEDNKANGADFLLIGMTQTSSGIYIIQTVDGSFMVHKQTSRFVTLGSGSEVMKKYVETNKNMKFVSDLTRVDFCKDGVQTAAVGDADDATGGKFINVLHVRKGEPGVNRYTYVRREEVVSKGKKKDDNKEEVKYDLQWEHGPKTNKKTKTKQSKK